MRRSTILFGFGAALSGSFACGSSPSGAKPNATGVDASSSSTPSTSAGTSPPPASGTSPYGGLDSAIQSGPIAPGADGSVEASSGADGFDGGPIDGSATIETGGETPEDAVADARSDAASLLAPYGSRLVSIFDGTSLTGWTVVVDGKVTNSNPTQWTVVDGAMHSTGANRNFMYYAPQKYGDFRFIFTVRLLSDAADTSPHVPCVLFWGSSTTDDAMDALQVQPPKGYTWDYRKSPEGVDLNAGGGAAGSIHVNGYPDPDTSWAQCEMLANVAAGTMRMACCPSEGDAKCAGAPAVEILDLTVQTPAAVRAPMPYYLALQTHTGDNGAKTGQIEEFKDLYVESPVMDPTTFVTTQ